MALYVDDATAGLFRVSVNVGFYFHLATEPDPLLLWSGIGDIEQTLPPVQTMPEVYRTARITQWDEFEVMLNGGAERATFTLEGVSAEASSAIAGEDPQVLGKALYIGMAAHDTAWQPVTPIIALATAIADYWSMSQQPAQGTGTPTRNLSLSVGFGETGRARPRRLIYSDTHTQARFPGDTFARDVPRYRRGFVISWPRF